MGPRRRVLAIGAGMAALALVAVLAGSACRKDGPPVPGTPVAPAASSAARAAAPMDPRTARLWEEARDGQEDELARLAQHEGPSGLEERAVDPALRDTALRAMGHTDSFDGLPLLARAAAQDDAPLALAAAESAVMLAARPRRAVDPEDALELRAGCDGLAAAMKDAARPRAVRVACARALRMLADRGCAAEVPGELEAK